MNYYDILLAKKLAENEGGGGSSVGVEPLSVTENGTYTAEQNKAFSPVTVNVPQGTTEIEPKDINFFDYDGTCLYAYSQDEWANVTELPSNPSHDGLVAQGWNWTKAEIDEQLRDVGGCVQVGQVYDTTTGATEIDIVLEDSDNLSPYLNIAVNGSVSVDWGDSTASTITGTSLTTEINTKHEYSSVGSYTIKISKVSGSYTFYTANTSSSSHQIINGGNYANVGSIYSTESVKHIRIGSSASSFSGIVFYYLYGLKYITFPSNMVFPYSSTILNAFSNCINLKIVIIPKGVTTINKGMFGGCNNIKTVSLPISMTIFPTVGGTGALTIPPLVNICVPKGVTSYEGSTNPTYIYAKKVHIPAGITEMNSGGLFTAINANEIVFKGNITAFGSGTKYLIQNAYCLTKFTLPSTVTVLGTSPFKTWGSLKEIHFQSTTPPTLGSSDAFYVANGIKIYVPYSADHSVLNTYKTATNWSTYANYMLEESA